jgi:hypothetical protein
MRYLILTLALLLPAIARADASVNSDAGRNIESGQSSTIKRDKSLSTDKSNGRKATDSTSRENSTETSSNRSKSTKTSQTSASSSSASVDVNINGLLLREFTARYERDGGGGGKAGEYFGICKPLTHALSDYPVIFGEGIVGRREAQEQALRQGFTTTWANPLSVRFQHNDPTFSRYVQCRITASYWVAEAGKRAANAKVNTEDEVSRRIVKVFAEMDADDYVFQTLRQRARDLWRQETCSLQLQQLSEFKSPDMQCGIFSFIGDTFTVENRTTLSESSIDGHSYKIAVSSSAGDAVAVDDTYSSDDKVSLTNKDGVSIERFKESKKTASMNKSRSTDNNTSSKLNRSSGNNMNSTPTKD